MEVGQKKELCIVHIGMPKTGSTSLQKALFNGIEDERVSYANLPDFNHSVAIYGMFTENPMNYHMFSKYNYSANEIKEFNRKNKKLLIDSFLNNKKPVEIISGEDIYHLTLNEIKQFKIFLEVYFKRILIVAYVRAPKSMTESAFQQLVKYNDLASLNIDFIYHPYKNFERFDVVFGKDNVKLWKYEPNKMVNQDIYSDFCEKIGLNYTRGNSAIRLNESISKEAIAILFTHNFFNKQEKKLQYTIEAQHILVKLLSKIGNEKFTFSNIFIKEMLENKKDDFVWIQNRMNHSLNENLEIYDMNGISNEQELMEYATNSIDELVHLVDNTSITFELSKQPKTVAKLVDLLLQKIHNEVHQKQQGVNQ